MVVLSNLAKHSNHSWSQLRLAEAHPNTISCNPFCLDSNFTKSDMSYDTQNTMPNTCLY